jgi:hypothetical protein
VTGRWKFRKKSQPDACALAGEGTTQPLDWTPISLALLSPWSGWLARAPSAGSLPIMRDTVVTAADKCIGRIQGINHIWLLLSIDAQSRSVARKIVGVFMETA